MALIPSTTETVISESENTSTPFQGPLLDNSRPGGGQVNDTQTILTINNTSSCSPDSLLINNATFLVNETCLLINL